MENKDNFAISAIEKTSCKNRGIILVSYKYVIIVMDDIRWLFDGIGTEIISAILGLLVGSYAGYKVGYKKGKIKQYQKAGNNASQIQIGINDGRE